MSRYTDENWNGLEGIIATGDGQLLVCAYLNNTVDVVTEDGAKIKTLLDSTKGIYFPGPICYSADQNMLFVANIKDDLIRVYKLSK